MIFEMLYPIQHVIIRFAVADTVLYRGEEHFRSRALIKREPLIIGSGTLNGGAKC